MVEYKDGLITAGFVASLERPGKGCPSPSSMFQSEGLLLIIELAAIDVRNGRGSASGLVPQSF